MQRVGGWVSAVSGEADAEDFLFGKTLAFGRF